MKYAFLYFTKNSLSAVYGAGFVFLVCLWGFVGGVVGVMVFWFDVVGVGCVLFFLVVFGWLVLVGGGWDVCFPCGFVLLGLCVVVHRVRV
ncbi:hypothetical protein [Actinotignum urinale]|uniref:hypothetical protein n=1 Tax=Actinotignum urinale TaxID=190146 RepID=UPI00370D9808